MKQDTFRLIVETLIRVPTGTLGTLLDLLRRITHPETGQAFTVNLKNWLAGRKKLVDVDATGLIRWLGTTTTSATTERFVAKDKFYEYSKDVKFCGFFDSFRDDFICGSLKIEDPVGEQILRYGDLIRPARDLPDENNCTAIIPELGGNAKAETALTEFYYLLKNQGNGEKEGVLLIDGRTNIFYIKNIHGVLRAVSADWADSGWCVYSCSVEDLGDWNAGDRVFSRKPLDLAA